MCVATRGAGIEFANFAVQSSATGSSACGKKERAVKLLAFKNPMELLSAVADHVSRLECERPPYCPKKQVQQSAMIVRRAEPLGPFHLLMERDPSPLIETAHLLHHRNHDITRLSVGRSSETPPSNASDVGFGVSAATSGGGEDGDVVGGVGGGGGEHDLDRNSTHSNQKRRRAVWTKAEDALLADLVRECGVRAWTSISRRMGSSKSGKQCRERWVHHLDPDVRKKGWTREEDRVILQKRAELGNRWSEIARSLPGRTENGVKNRFNSTLKRQLRAADVKV